MKVISTLRSVLTKLICQATTPRNGEPSDKSQSEISGWNSSYAATTTTATTTDHYQPTLRTKTAVRSARASERRPGLYYVRKKGSPGIWVEKVDKHGQRTQLTRPYGGGGARKARPRKQKKSEDDDDSQSRWDGLSQWTSQGNERTAQYVMSQSPQTYVRNASSLYSRED
jgi:hypothetical protein